MVDSLREVSHCRSKIRIGSKKGERTYRGEAVNQTVAATASGNSLLVADFLSKKQRL
jgi:hypothetical protein